MKLEQAYETILLLTAILKYARHGIFIEYHKGNYYIKTLSEEQRGMIITTEGPDACSGALSQLLELFWDSISGTG